MIVNPVSRQSLNIFKAAEWIENRTFSFEKLDLLAQGVGDHQNITKHDRRIHVIAPKRLQRDFDSQVR